MTFQAHWANGPEDLPTLCVGCERTGEQVAPLNEYEIMFDDGQITRAFYCTYCAKGLAALFSCFVLIKQCELCGRELDTDVNLCPRCDSGSPYFATMRNET